MKYIIDVLLLPQLYFVGYWFSVTGSTVTLWAIWRSVTGSTLTFWAMRNLSSKQTISYQRTPIR